MDRRGFLRATAAAVAMVSGAAASAAPQPPPSVLWLVRKGESYRFDFSTPEGYQTANWMLRDIQAGGVVGMASARTLYSLAWGQAYLAAYGHHHPYSVHSGLRMPSTNARTRGADKHSFHLPVDPARRDLRFFAADVAMPSVPAPYLARLVATPSYGRIILYPQEGFIHFDDSGAGVRVSRRKTG